MHDEDNLYEDRYDGFDDGDNSSKQADYTYEGEGNEEG